VAWRGEERPQRVGGNERGPKMSFTCLLVTCRPPRRPMRGPMPGHAALERPNKLPLDSVFDYYTFCVASTVAPNRCFCTRFSKRSPCEIPLFSLGYPNEDPAMETVTRRHYTCQYLITCSAAKHTSRRIPHFSTKTPGRFRGNFVFRPKSIPHVSPYILYRLVDRHALCFTTISLRSADMS